MQEKFAFVNNSVILLLMLQTTAYKHEIPWHCRFVMFVSHKNCHLDQLTAVMCEIKVVYSILLFKTYCCKLTNNSSHYKITISYLEFWTFTDFIHYVECFYIRQSISEKKEVCCWYKSLGSFIVHASWKQNTGHFMIHL